MYDDMMKMYLKKNGKYYTLLTCAVWSVSAFINSDKVLNNENRMKIKQLANLFQSINQRCNDSAFWDSRLNSDSDEVFGFNSNSIL